MLRSGGNTGHYDKKIVKEDALLIKEWKMLPAENIITVLSIMYM